MLFFIILSFTVIMCTGKMQKSVIVAIVLCSWLIACHAQNNGGNINRPNLLLTFQIQ